MKVAVLKTNNGPHPPEKWAEQTAEQLVDVIIIEPTYPDYTNALQQKNILKDKLVALLTRHHAKVQSDERDHIEKRASRIMETIDPTQHTESATDDVIRRCVAGTMFADHFQKPEVLAFVHSIIASHFATAMHIERSWHADRNPSDESAKQFRATHHPGA